jgi:hypothetical protein
MPTADLRKYRKSTRSVQARKAPTSLDLIATKKIKKPADLEAKLREFGIDPAPLIEHGLSESAKLHTTRLATFLR